SKIKAIICRYPAPVITLPYILGILLSYFYVTRALHTGLSLSLHLQVLLAALILFLYSKIRLYEKAYIFLFITLIAFGVVRFYSVYSTLEPGNISGKINEMQGKSIKLFGYLLEPPDQDYNRIKFIISSDSIVTYNGCTQVTGNVMVSVFKNKYSENFVHKFNYGDYVQLDGELEQLPHKRNPGEFDYGEYLKLHGIEASFTSFGYDKISFMQPTNPSIFKKNIIYPIKKYTMSAIDTYIGGDEGEFMKGLVLGERSNISKEIKENFVNDGISHIIAVSGLNVAYVIIIVTLLLQLFPLRNSGRILITILVLIFYMNLTGNVPSIVRATIMSCVFLVSLLFERKIISLNVVALSALVILLVDPRQIFDAGFILSFWAILSMVIIFPKLQHIVDSIRYLNNSGTDKLSKRTLYAFLIFVMGTFAAQIGTIPITAFMFKKVSLVSLVTNMVAIPVSNLAMAMGFLLVLTSLVSSWAAAAIGVTSAFILKMLLVFIDFFAHLNFSFIETYTADYFFLLCFYALVYFLLFHSKSRLPARIAISLLIVANYFVFKTVFTVNDNLNAAYLDVGNSNACCISLPDESSVLINSGGSSLKYCSAERNIIPYLKLRGKNYVDVICVTSLDKDEFRNLLYMVSHFRVDKIFCRGIYRSLFEDSSCVKIFSRTAIFYVDSPSVFKEKPDIRLFLIPDNNSINSLTVVCIYGSREFVFTDVEDRDYQTFLKFGKNVKTSVLKVPFSGSFDFTSPEFIAHTNPENVVISSFRGRKQYNSDVFERSLKEIGFNVFKISENGAVIFETDGEKIKLVEWN
ncbi:MAG: ComEC/Rec2 family competence protein, partial [Ignavibacteria bacterium]